MTTQSNSKFQSQCEKGYTNGNANYWCVCRLTPNTLSINGLICSEMSSMYKKYVYDIRNSTDSKELNIVLNSSGGDVHTAIEIVDLNEDLKDDGYQINMYGTGTIMSATTAIFSTGTNRYLTKGTRIMHHPVVTKHPSYDNAKVLHSKINNTEMIDKYLQSIIAKNCNLTSEKVSEMGKFETYFDAYEYAQLCASKVQNQFKN
jgi:ATP-dependent protease ClpP protease subunit